MQNSHFLFEVGLNHYLVVSALLFMMGLTGILLRRNLIVMMMSIELMLNSVNVAFVAFSKYTENLNGQIFVFFIMTVAAAEAAVGLAIVVSIFKRYNEVNSRFFEHLKG